MTLQAAEQQLVALQELQTAAAVRFVLSHKPNEDEESVEIKKSILECCDSFKGLLHEFSETSNQEAIPLPDIIEPHSLNDLHEYTRRYLHKADSADEALKDLPTYVKTFPKRGSNEWMLRVYNFLVTVNYFDLHYQNNEAEEQAQKSEISRQKLMKRQSTFSRQRNELLGHEIASVLLDPVFIQDIDSAVIHKMITTPYEYYIQDALKWSSVFCEKTLTGVNGHRDYVTSVAWSPNGTKIVSGSGDYNIKIWHTTTGACFMTLTGDDGHKDWVRSVAWSYDGTKIISGSDDKTIKIWDAIIGICLMTLTGANGHNNAVMSVAWNNDGTRIISGSDDKTIKIWDAITGTCLITLTDIDRHRNCVRSVAWNSDGTKIVSGSDDTTIKIWDALTGTCLMTLAGDNGHRSFVMSVAWSSDGTKIASGSADKTVKIWNAVTGVCLMTLTGANGHRDLVRSVAWSPDSAKIASGSIDKTIKIWDAVTGICLMTLIGTNDHSAWVMSVTWSNDGTKIASGSADHTIKIWTIPESGQQAYNMWLQKHYPEKLLDEGK